MQNTGNQNAFVGSEGTWSKYYPVHRYEAFSLVTEICSDETGTTGIVELPPVMNLTSGTYWSNDPFIRHTGYITDSLYSDLTRYFINAWNDPIHSTGYTKSLTSIECSVAAVALTLIEEGYTVSLCLYSDQTGLQTFCRDKGWHFEVLARGN